MKRGKVNRDVADVCQGGNIRVAFNQDVGFFEVEDNKMVEYNGLGLGFATNYEILSSFFIANRLTATFFDNNYTWGFWDEEAGQWRGAVAMVRTYIDTKIISFFFFSFTHIFVLRKLILECEISNA